MDSNRATEFFKTVRPEVATNMLNYWERIRPTDHQTYYNMWIFGFMSIHTSWTWNVIGHLSIMRLPQNFSWATLRATIQRCGVGLTKMRTTGIWQFHKKFWSDPEVWYKQSGESFHDFRERLLNQSFGIGRAKISFVLEMAYPKECDVVCLDTHLLQLYGHKPGEGSPGKQQYAEMEDHWVTEASRQNVSPAIARHIFWNRKQNRRNTRYWSWVFEKELQAYVRQEQSSNHRRERGSPRAFRVTELQRAHSTTCNERQKDRGSKNRRRTRDQKRTRCVLHIDV